MNTSGSAYFLHSFDLRDVPNRFFLPFLLYTILIHLPNVTTKHDKKSNIAAGGPRLKKIINILLCFFKRCAVVVRWRRKIFHRENSSFLSAIDHEGSFF